MISMLSISGQFRCFLIALIGGVLASSGLGAVVLTAPEQAIAYKMVGNPGQHRPFMVLDATLTAVARARALDMGRRHYFNHTNPDGNGPNYLLKSAGYTLPAEWSTDRAANNVESIAAGRPDADSTWNDWMASSAHKNHLLAGNAFYAAETSYGVGVVTVPGSPYSTYWVVITAPPIPAPQLTVTTPLAAARVSTDSVAVSGTTGSFGAPAQVVWRVENSAGMGNFSPASGVAAWSANAAGLQPGANTIRVRSLTATGGTLLETTRLVTYAVPAPLTVSTSGSGVVTTGFLGTTTRELGARYTVSAAPAAGSVFLGWSGSAASKSASLAFTMMPDFAVSANFVPNPFPTRVGAYAGLLSGAAPGLLQISLTSTGAFTGTLRYNGTVSTLRGAFANDGTATLQVPRAGTTPLTVTLALDVSGTGGVSATVDDAGTTSSTTATTGYKSVAGSRFAGAGQYTVSLPPIPAEGAPQGSGYATVTFDTLGRGTLSGFLADGTSFTYAGAFSGENVFAFYVPLYAGKGALSGSFSLRQTEASDFDGSIRWSKPAQPGKVQAAAFDLTGSILGSTYLPPKPGKLPLNSASGTSSASLQLADGDLAAPVTQPATVSAARLVFSQPALPGLTVNFYPTLGIFVGNFTHPVTKKATPVRGVLFQRQNAGAGFFLGSAASGSVKLSEP